MWWWFYELGIDGDEYPLVDVYITMENNLFEWEHLLCSVYGNFQ